MRIAGTRIFLQKHCVPALLRLNFRQDARICKPLYISFALR